MKKGLLVLTFLTGLLLAALPSQGALTYGQDYFRKNIRSFGAGPGRNDPYDLFLGEIEDIIDDGTFTFLNGLTIDNEADGVMEWNETSEELKWTFTTNAVNLSSTSGVVLMDWGTIVPKADQFLYDPVADAVGTVEGTVYYDSDDDNLYVRTSAGWIDLTAGAGTVTDMDTAYNGGSAVDVDTDAVGLTVSDTDNNLALILTQNDTTNNPNVMQIVNAGTGIGLDIDGQAGGRDIEGTGASWYVTGAGAAVFNTVTTTGTTTFGDGTSTVAVNSSVWDITTTGAVSGVTTLGMSGDLTLSAGDVVVASGNGVKGSTTDAQTVVLQAYDVDNTTFRDVLTLTNGNTIAAALGTGNETVAVNSTTWDVSTAGAFTGVADITGTAGEAMTITLASDGAADDLTLSVTGATDSSVILSSAGTGTDAIKLIATAGGIDIDATNDDLSITNTANGAADDLTIAQAGNFDSSLLITSAGSGADALSLTTTANGGDIVVSSNDKIDIDSTGTFDLNAAGDTLTIQVDSDGAGDDLTIKVDGDDDSSIILDSDGTGADAIKIHASNAAGGLDVDAGTGGIAVTATGGAIALSSTKNAASAIALTANGGTSETITVTNTQGTDAAAIGLTATAGGITLTPASAKTVTVAGSLTLTSDVYVDKGDDVASPAGGELDLGTGTYFDITGTNNITSIAAADSIAGRMIVLQFDAILTFTDGNNLKLAGNLVTSADDTITLICDGTNWHEMARSAN
jgi:hypothetical protein